MQLEIGQDLTFSQQVVSLPACLPARCSSSSCNMWDQSIEKLIDEVEKRPALYLKSRKEYSDINYKKKEVVGRGVYRYSQSPSCILVQDMRFQKKQQFIKTINTHSAIIEKFCLSS